MPAVWSGKILLPYAVESTLSGVGQLLAPDRAPRGSSDTSASCAAAAPTTPNVINLLADDLGWSETTCTSRARSARHPAPDASPGADCVSPTPPPRIRLLPHAREPPNRPLSCTHRPHRCDRPSLQVMVEKSPVQKAVPTAKVLVARSVTRLDPSDDTLATVIKAGGYATGHFGKWHLRPAPYSLLHQGFEVDFPLGPDPVRPAAPSSPGNPAPRATSRALPACTAQTVGPADGTSGLIKANRAKLTFLRTPPAEGRPLRARQTAGRGVTR